jgi:hypothetical protein
MMVGQEDGFLLSSKAIEQIYGLIRSEARKVVNDGPHRRRYQYRGGGGGTHTIWFLIQSVLCPEVDYVSQTTLVVTAMWYTGACGAVPPYANDDGTYDVIDICNYLSGLTPADLEGGVGRATLMRPINTDPCTPQWIIDDLCPQPEC